MDEFELIRHFFHRPGPGAGVVVGPGDDAAVLSPAPGQLLVMTTDTLIGGSHFPEDLPPGDIGWRSLAVNLSDLAAMGARPRWCLLSLTLPSADETWLQRFSDGFHGLADQTGIVLVGGDLTRGPLSVTVQAVGEVPPGRALLRSGARPGDRVCIGGVPGEAAAGLVLWRSGQRDGELVERFARPEPRLGLGIRLRGLASACIDVSDGLLADLGHILEESGAPGAVLETARLPLSPALSAWGDDQSRLRAQLAGGDDYLLLFTLPPAFTLPKDCHEIGRITAEPGLRVLGADGRAVVPGETGWKHF